MGWILRTANAIRNKKAPKRFIRAETPMSSRVAIDESKHHTEREKRWRKRLAFKERVA